MIHDDGEGLALHHEIADGDDARVPEPDQHRPLPDEPLHERRVLGVLRLQDLRGEAGAVGRRLCEPDIPRRSRADMLHEAVPGPEGVARSWLNHRFPLLLRLLAYCIVHLMR
ncbi:glutamate synthase subunit alpha [Leifsonia xyli subsp. cynodontis DSM 46306]|uniref:Uncharacterized protein n=1 Tax=Leifsonia xyli subsp. cynodontis DSM 46306 TaxID=1389489 RepID=U3P7A1_LEIXC|nr:glutamate synthase subunit alpha [Leifsonia xyli subsp. cynodontis DSM 46306]